MTLRDRQRAVIYSCFGPDLVRLRAARVLGVKIETIRAYVCGHRRMLPRQYRRILTYLDYRPGNARQEYKRRMARLEREFLAQERAFASAAHELRALVIAMEREGKD